MSNTVNTPMQYTDSQMRRQLEAFMMINTEQNTFQNPYWSFLETAEKIHI